MNRAQIKEWAKKKIKTNFWLLVGVTLVTGILNGLAYYHTEINGYTVKTTYYSFGWIFYFVEVGLTYFLVKFINDKEVEFKDIFHFASDFLRCLGAILLQALFIFLWMLLLIVPGIIKAFSYALVPYLLADEKYKDMGLMDILKKSQEMMNGHKADLFVFFLSFIGWHLLAPLTLFILEIWIIPYQTTATAKFLNDIKDSYEGKPSSTNVNQEAKPSTTFCPQCGKELKDGTSFCSNCGYKL